jgi:type I restriction enzyme S subunit
MKNNWTMKKLGEVCELVRGPFGGSLKKSIFVQEGFAVYEQQHAINNQFKEVRYFISEKKFKEMKRFELHSRDMIMSCSGTMGKVAIVPEKIQPGIINQALLKLTPSKLIFPEFLKYWMSSEDFQKSLEEQSGGAAIQNVASVGVLKEIRVPLPTLKEQKQIVEIIDDTFKEVAKAKENAEKNLQNSRKLFESYLQSIFANGHGWEVKNLGDVCEYFNGKAHEQCIDEDGRYIVVNSKFISSDGQIFKKTNDALFPLFCGDIVMVLSDVPNGKALAKCYLIDKNDTYSLNQRICAIRSKRFDNKFLYYQINRNKHFLNFDNGENQTNLRLNQILSCPLFLPPQSEQKNIPNQLDQFRTEIRKLESIYQQKLANLVELKKSVLHKAFNGELAGVCS